MSDRYKWFDKQQALGRPGSHFVGGHGKGLAPGRTSFMHWARRGRRSVGRGYSPSQHAVATELASGPATLYGDCSNVVSAAKTRVMDALSWRKPHAGSIRGTHRHKGRKHIREDVKVKAHVSVDSVEDPVLKRHAKGNDYADETAKLGASMHPVLALNDKSVEAYARKLTAVARTIAHTCQMWPKSSSTNGKLRRTRRASSFRTMVSEGSGGQGSLQASVVSMADASHCLFASGQLSFCGICGAYSEVRVSKKFVEPCARKAVTPQQRHQRDTLMTGRHPVTGRSIPKAVRSGLN